MCLRSALLNHSRRRMGPGGSPGLQNRVVSPQGGRKVRLLPFSARSTNMKNGGTIRRLNRSGSGVFVALRFFDGSVAEHTAASWAGAGQFPEPPHAFENGRVARSRPQCTVGFFEGSESLHRHLTRPRGGTLPSSQTHRRDRSAGRPGGCPFPFSCSEGATQLKRLISGRPQRCGRAEPRRRR
jgi:hypothetical protein